MPNGRSRWSHDLLEQSVRVSPCCSHPQQSAASQLVTTIAVISAEDWIDGRKSLVSRTAVADCLVVVVNPSRPRAARAVHTGEFGAAELESPIVYDRGVVRQNANDEHIARANVYSRCLPVIEVQRLELDQVTRLSCIGLVFERTGGPPECTVLHTVWM